MESKTACKGINIRRVEEVKGPPLLGKIAQDAVQARLAKNLAAVIAKHGLPAQQNTTDSSSTSEDAHHPPLRRVAGG